MQSSDQPGKGPVDELLRPVIRCGADSEIHKVDLDLPAPMEGQPCNRMLALRRSDLVVPEIIRQGTERGVQPLSPVANIRDQLVRGPVGPGLDLCIASLAPPGY